MMNYNDIYAIGEVYINDIKFCFRLNHKNYHVLFERIVSLAVLYKNTDFACFYSKLK
jgi:hypothetical protein